MAVKKPANDAFDFAAFDISKMGESFRELAEKSITQSNDAYDQFKVAAEDATASTQKSFDAVRDGMSELSAKAIENTKTNTEAGMSFFEKLASAKTFSEAIELQGEFFRTSFETLSAQSREAQELTMKVGEKAAAPARQAAQKATDKAVETVTTKAA